MQTSIRTHDENGNRTNYPKAIYRKAHALYPQTVADLGLYGAAFFGHSIPKDLTHKQTPNTVWRGLLRKLSKAHALGESDAN